MGGGGNLMRKFARLVGHLTIEEMLASGNKLRDYVEKAKATRLRKKQHGGEFDQNLSTK